MLIFRLGQQLRHATGLPCAIDSHKDQISAGYVPVKASLRVFCPDFDADFQRL
jgi:hypothetical protein